MDTLFENPNVSLLYQRNQKQRLEKQMASGRRATTSTHKPTCKMVQTWAQLDAGQSSKTSINTGFEMNKVVWMAQTANHLKISRTQSKIRPVPKNST